MHNKWTLTMVLLFCSFVAAYSQTYTMPPYSAKDVADWTVDGTFIASGSAEPTATVNPGRLYVDITDPALPKLWRYDGSDWRQLSGADPQALTDHIASHTDPHGASMTVSESITIGDGATFFELVALDSATIIASGTRFAVASAPEFVDNDAAIAGGLATGTLYRTGDALKIVW
jgi:hypothetical protein